MGRASFANASRRLLCYEFFPRVDNRHIRFHSLSEYIDRVAWREWSERNAFSAIATPDIQFEKEHVGGHVVDY